VEEGAGGRRDRLVHYLPLADEDLSFAYAMTRERWRKTQAEKYLDFLIQSCQEIADGAVQGHKLDGNPLISMSVARFSSKRMSHGHRLFYREVEGGIEIVRILHTAMDWRDENI